MGVGYAGVEPESRIFIKNQEFLTLNLKVRRPNRAAPSAHIR